MLSIPALIIAGIPWSTRVFTIALLPVAWLNLRDITRNQTDRRTLEKLSVRTRLFDHTVTFIYAAAFIITGVAAGGAGGTLVVILFYYLFVFALEGMSLFISTRVPR